MCITKSVIFKLEHCNLATSASVGCSTWTVGNVNRFCTFSRCKSTVFRASGILYGSGAVCSAISPPSINVQWSFFTNHRHALCYVSYSIILANVSKIDLNLSTSASVNTSVGCSTWTVGGDRNVNRFCTFSWCKSTVFRASGILYCW